MNEWTHKRKPVYFQDSSDLLLNKFSLWIPISQINVPVHIWSLRNRRWNNCHSEAVRWEGKALELILDHKRLHIWILVCFLLNPELLLRSFSEKKQCKWKQLRGFMCMLGEGFTRGDTLKNRISPFEGLLRGYLTQVVHSTTYFTSWTRSLAIPGYKHWGT